MADDAPHPPSMQEELKTKFQFTEEQLAVFSRMAEQMLAGNQLDQIFVGMTPAEATDIIKIASSIAQVMADSNVGCVEMKELHAVIKSLSDQYQEMRQGGALNRDKLNQLMADAAAIKFENIRENDHGPKWDFEKNQ